MAYLGGRQVCDKFIEALEADYQGREFSFSERGKMRAIASALGLACQSDPGIFRYLTNHLTPESWTPLRTWKGPSGPAQDPDLVMANRTIVGIGLCGKPQARAMLEELLNSPPTKLQDIGGAVVEGLFYLSMSAEHDRAALVQIYSNPEMAVRLLSNWRGQPEGKRYWDLWLQRRDGGDAKKQNE